jgi:hypothetical protein
MLDPARFRAAFQRFMAGFSGQCEGGVALFGKVERHSFDKASGKSPLPWSALGAARGGWCWRRSPRTPNQSEAMRGVLPVRRRLAKIVQKARAE